MSGRLRLRGPLAKLPVVTEAPVAPEVCQSIGSAHRKAEGSQLPGYGFVAASDYKVPKPFERPDIFRAALIT